MAITTIKGRYQEALRYHYDVGGDVLYVRLLAYDHHEIWGEEDAHGFVVLHFELDDRLVGYTVIGFWRRFGNAIRVADQPAAVLDAAILTLVDEWWERGDFNDHT